MNRRIIKVPKLRSYFRFEFKYFSFSNNLHYNSQIFNNFSFLILLIAISCVFGLFKPLFWAVGLAVGCLITFLYFKTRRLTQGLTIMRKMPVLAREKRQIEIHYLISNETAFTVDSFQFTEEFDGIQSGHFRVAVENGIPPHTRLRVTKKLLLDAGMGLKKIQPTRLIIKDDLGIFDFEVIFGHEEEVEVYPQIEETPPLKASISPETIEFGFYEVSKRGDSNLFIGTREYRHGDPVKHINWKLSRKTHKVVVNEFEKNTNTFVTLIVDLDYGNQVGSGALSTWESAKDLALSITSNEIRKNNLIQILANNLYLEFGSGRNQLDLLERHFTFHEMQKGGEGHHLRHLENLPDRGQVYYIAPMITTPKILEHLEIMKTLMLQGQKVVVFLLDPYPELMLQVKGEMRLGLMELERNTREEFVKIEQELKSRGIGVISIKVSRTLQLQEQLLEKARELLELK